MMRFSKLRLLGFKSFVEPTEFVIENGLTGVVGPNGCGKSNLVEALRWVMGESSYKNMRASGMDDVIFSGSATRPSRNTAEVSLFLDNRGRDAPAAWNDSEDLQVTRRIEREAGSAYRINGKEARAKDVQLLFADQSTGARSPSMVGQGRIGELIQAKPQARRALLEEAAGISGLHSRRHDAELRLRAAEQNFERLDDVIGELQSQIDNLKRQARQAVRFRNLSSEIRQLEAVLLHVRWTAARDQVAEGDRLLTEATSAVAEEAQKQMNAAKEQAVAAAKLPGLRDAEAQAAAALQRMTIARTQLEDEANRLRARVEELTRRLAQYDADIAREKGLVDENGAAIRRLDAEQAELAAEGAGSAEREADLQQAAEHAARALAGAESAHQAVTAERAESAAAIGAAERALRDEAQRRDRYAQQISALDRDLAEIAERIAALPDPAAKRSDVEAVERRIAAAEMAVADAESRVAQTRSDEQAARAPLQDMRAALNRLEAESRTLAKILNAASGGLFPAVVEQLKVERGFEAALGAALGEELDLPLDRSAPAYWAGSEPDAADAPLPDGAIPISAFVRGPAQIARRLAHIGVVLEADGNRLQNLLRPGQRLVSREGAVWRWDGYTASAEAPTAAAQRLAQKNRLAELEAEIAGMMRTVRSAEAEQADREVALAAALDQERAARDALRDAQRAVVAAHDALAAAERASGELSSRRAALEESRARAGETMAEALAAFANAEHALAMSPDLGALDARLRDLAADVSANRAKAAEARAAHEGYRREVETRARRLSAIAQERDAWTRRAENAASQIAALEARRTESASELSGLAEVPDDLEHRRRQVMNQLTQAEALRSEAADRLASAETAQRDLDKAATDAIQSLAQSREARARAEERLNAAKERHADAEARIAEALHCAPHEAFAHTGLAEGASLLPVDEVDRRLERLKIDRERLGAVNLRAEEESRELSERLDTIVSERGDVVEAIKKLRQAIQSLNSEGRERLLGAFDKVNVEFKRLFAHLFGGGTAELQLIESDDPLEAGLEILARPPGKKPQTMTLLSGGEQALTAMALIFAVFLTNPAPICVLDEVDAPLDDHNVERFCNLMDEMASSTDTRFVIITHNPITMARMDRLFGVTMAEQGVSQLVSVDLRTAEHLREAS
jgi:chromosome segregation protein